MRPVGSTLGVKKIIFLLVITFLLVGCGNNDEQGVVEETGEIMNDYVDTLEGSVQDARTVKELMEQNNQKLEDDLKNVY